ncbi:kinase-like domain protein [Fusarium subglutinans]|uniref:Kinase-like domain protein n=1 Tax=Gibberella subglutinans TaxID=42677 RepID=A0A8H5V3V4_GIBSU|nr:kinase-like domain protein [Fusarium subglutinans]KAF5609616.1 kinase-like domain protein [Fusarium subglutinans]
MGDASDGVGVEGILKVVKSLRQEGMAASFCFGTDLAPLSGKQCWVYAIGFPDQTTWAIRVPVHIKNLPPDIISNTVEEEASVLKRLERCDFSWSPRLIGYCSGFDNPIAYPYIVSTWIHGSPLQWTDDIPCSRESRDSLLRQMGEILMQLAERTQCQGIGGDAVTFLTDIIDRKLSRALRGGLPDISPQSCLLQRALVRNTFASTADPMVLSHEDLDPSNIIVDEQCNIQGQVLFYWRTPWRWANTSD